MTSTPGRRSTLAIAFVVVVLGVAAPAATQIVKKCPPDSVKVGTTCVDTYEASAWSVPNPTGSGKKLVKKIQTGKVTLADLTAAAAVQLGCNVFGFTLTPFPPTFPATGNWTPIFGSSPPTPGIYAVSIAGVPPTNCITPFQAQQACRLAGKHLITNDEWQSAAAGTPDPGNLDDGVTTCVTNSNRPDDTGARSGCVSSWGVHDMVGNVREWVSDWVDLVSGANNQTDWTTSAGIAGGDLSFFGAPGGLGLLSIPGALSRGGIWSDGVEAGVFYLSANNHAFNAGSAATFNGFRCAR